ncbi:MAG: glycosyl hydrolase [Halieaceae bacterium]|nr:glycosyl hydrolase [Halieaceae bacterium]
MPRIHVCLRWLATLCLVLSAGVYADIDPDTFPADLRALEWREIGPYRGGRSAAVTGIPSDRETYYMGVTGGGVWKTGNGGSSWENVSDGYFGGSVGAVAVSEWDPNVVYVGLGEKTVRGNVSPGNGIWRSNDAGDTWKKLGLEDTQHISRIRVHPKNPDLVYVAAMGHLFGANTERGVYRSRDGGQSWEKVLFVSDEVGAVDLAMDPTNPRILYASFWRVKRTPYSLESGGEGSGLYKSTDGGDSWELISDNEGFPTGTIGIIGITVSPGNNKNLYAIVEAEDGGVLRSRDGGETWTRVSEDRNLRQRAWYYTRIYADPDSEEGVYVLNVRFHHSRDGGKSFGEIPTPHGDNHDLWIDPSDPLRMVQANDGGGNVSYDGGKTWSVQSNQPTAQMYRVSTDNAFPFRLLGGQQDNSAVRIRSHSAMSSSITRRDWEPTAGGESGHVVAKPDNPDIVVGGSYGGYLTLMDHRTGAERAIDVWPDNPMGWGAAELKYRFQWNFPIAFSVHDPDVLYVAADVLFRSDDLGRTWQLMSPDLTRNDKSRMGASGGPITKDNTGVEYYGTIFALAESQHEQGVLWAGTDDGRVHVTRDNGGSWQDVTPSNLPDWAQVNSLEIDPHNPAGAYLAATRYKSDDFAPYLFHTTNWGKSWRKITRGIPAMHFTRALRADPDREGLLYAGTEFGIYFSLDKGRNWRPLQLNLPQVSITDLAVKDRKLVAATQGRGYWILDDLTVLHQLDASADGTRLYTPEPAWRRVAGAQRKEQPANAGTNAHPGVTFYYTLPEGLADDAEVSLEVLDGDDSLWTWTREPAPGDEEEPAGPNAPPATNVLPARAGLNRHAWDLSVPSFERFDDLILWIDVKSGPRVPPGSYRAVLTVDGESSSTEFTVVADPRSTMSQDDYDAQYAFAIGTRDLVSRTHEGITTIRKLKGQLESAKGRVEAESATATNITATIDKLTAIEETLYQTKNESRQDPLNFPIRLNNKLSYVMVLSAMSEAAPTAAMIAVRDELAGEINTALDELSAVIASDVPALNAELADLDMIALDDAGE